MMAREWGKALGKTKPDPRVVALEREALAYGERREEEKRKKEEERLSALEAKSKIEEPLSPGTPRGGPALAGEKAAGPGTAKTARQSQSGTVENPAFLIGDATKSGICRVLIGNPLVM